MIDYFQGTASASQMYRSSTSASTATGGCTAAEGNLSHMMKNATVYTSHGSTRPPAQGTPLFPEKTVSGLVIRRS